jgi:hypothetical protein
MRWDARCGVALFLGRCRLAAQLPAASRGADLHRGDVDVVPTAATRSWRRSEPNQSSCTRKPDLYANQILNPLDGYAVT